MVATLVVFIFSCVVLALFFGCVYVCVRAGALGPDPQNWAVQTVPKTGWCLLRVDFGGTAHPHIRSPGPLTLGRRLTLTACVVAPHIFFLGWRGGVWHTRNISREPYRSVEPSVLS